MNSSVESDVEPPESRDEADSETMTEGRTRARRHLLRAGIALLCGLVFIALVQYFASSRDHQNANLLSGAIGLLTILVTLYQLHRWSTLRGRRYAVPVAALAFVVVSSILFRMDGFSGEMVPQIRFRFAEAEPALRTLSDSSARSDVTQPPTTSPFSDAQSLGFLGNERSGIVTDRTFSIPRSASQVSLLWNQGVGQGWSSFAVSDGRAVTLEQRDDRECVTCYRLSDGELLWLESHQAYHQHPLGGVGPRSTPTIAGDRVFAQGATGVVWCLSLATGEVDWSVDLIEMAGWNQQESEAAISWGRAGSPLIVDGLCTVPYGGPESIAEVGRSLIALDVETGETKWTAGEDQISYASPGEMTLGGVRQIVSVNEKTVTGHAIANGAVLWSFDWPGASNAGANCAMQIGAGENRFLLGKGYGGGSALVEIERSGEQSLSAKPVWESSRLLKTKFNHAVVVGDIAYGISNGSLEAVQISEARRLWMQPRSTRLGQGQILLVEDTIVGQSESGEVVFVAADPAEYRELFRLDALTAKTWNVPTVAGRLLLVRNDREAFCFQLPARQAK